MIPKRAAYMFDELDSDSFARLCNVLIPLAHGQTGFSPSPLEGIDGGADSRSITGGSSELVNQYKFHNISSWADTSPKLRSKVLKEFSDFMEDMYKDSPGLYIFVTNVKRTKQDTDKTTKIINVYLAKGAKVEYWDSVRILSLMDSNPELYTSFLPHYVGHITGKQIEEIAKGKEELRQAQASLAQQRKTDYRSSEEFIKVSRKFKTQFIDWDLLAKNYHAFIYLVEPVYIDDNDGVRAIMRDLFHINTETETKILDILKKDGRIDITKNLITANEIEQASKVVEQMLAHMGTDLEKVITLIQGA